MYKIYSFLHIVLHCSVLLCEINISDEAWNLCCCSMWNNTLNIKTCKIWAKSYAFYRLSCLLMDMDDLENIKSKTKHKKATQYSFLNLGQGWESMNWLGMVRRSTVTLMFSICIKIQNFSDSPSINALHFWMFDDFIGVQHIKVQCSRLNVNRIEIQIVPHHLMNSQITWFLFLSL